jgi:hypothetical protein
MFDEVCQGDGVRQGDGSLDNSTYNTALTYVPGNDTNKTTGLIATYQNGSEAAYSYTYDDVGVGGTVLLTPYIIFGVDKLPRQCVCYIEGYDEARTSKRLSREPSL